MRFAGANLNSGSLSTGEVLFNRGGVRTATVYSGAIAASVVAAGTGSIGSGGSVLVMSGAGRLNSFTAHWPAGVALAGNGENAVVSGMPIVVYDSSITARSGLYVDGTISESGRKVLYTWSPPKLIASGALLLNGNGIFNPVPLDVPFFSGLCIMALSGATGYTLSYSVENNQAFP